MAFEITQELVRELFDYHKDGYLIWKVNRDRNKLIGKRAGYLNYQIKGDRYILTLSNKDYHSARIIYLWHTGEWPEIVDHENNITTDDRIENLRPASIVQNNRNKTSAKNSSSRYLGVCFFKTSKRPIAQIRVDGKRKFLGYFENENLAALAYNKEAVKAYGEFANLNIISNG